MQVFYWLVEHDIYYELTRSAAGGRHRDCRSFADVGYRIEHALNFGCANFNTPQIHRVVDAAVRAVMFCAEAFDLVAVPPQLLPA